MVPVGPVALKLSTFFGHVRFILNTQKGGFTVEWYGSGPYRRKWYLLYLKAAAWGIRLTKVEHS